MTLLSRLINRKVKPKHSTRKVVALEFMGTDKELVIFHHGKSYLLTENSHGELKLYK